MKKEEKENLLFRLKMHTMFIELFILFRYNQLNISEIDCLHDTMNTLNDIKTLLERL